MLPFTQWMALVPLNNDIDAARKSLGRALVVQNSNKSGLEILPAVNGFIDAIDRCSSKLGQNEDKALASDIASVFASLKDDAQKAVSEEDPGMRRYLLAGVLRRVDTELRMPQSLPDRNDVHPMSRVIRPSVRPDLE
jgi:hypothetical protein